MKISHKLDENGNPQFTLENVDHETLCSFLNGIYKSRKDYADHWANGAVQVAGRTDPREISAYLASLADIAYTMQAELREAEYAMSYRDEVMGIHWNF